jgi:TRAP transporter TAXI family solute receptor
MRRALVAAALLSAVGIPAYGQDLKFPAQMSWTAYDTGSSGFNMAVAIGQQLKKYNSDVRVLAAGNDTARLAPLRSGRAVASAMGIGTYFAQEGVFEFGTREWGPQPLQLLLSSSSCNAISLGVAKDTGVKEIKDLKGKRVGVVVGSPALTQNALGVLAFGNLTANDVKLVEFSAYGAMWKGMLNNEVDAAIASNISGQVKEVETSPRGIVFPPTPASDTAGWARVRKVSPSITPYYRTIFQWAIRSPETKETRHLLTAYMPITADGSVTKIYTGTKDYFLLSELSGDSLFSDPNGSLKAADGRSVSLVDLVNFSNYWWLRWLTKPLSIPILHALNFFNGITANYGVAIIIFTLLFYSLLFPLRWSQSKSFKKAAGNAPKMKAIQDQIKDLQKKGVPVDDPRMRTLQMEQLKMTKDALPIGGCLPMLLQFPLLIAFYTAITVSLDARQATFMWLPDLSAADPWHLLEFGFAFSMVLAMKFTPTAPAVSPEQQMQQKMMTYLMPVMMLWVMWTAPAGLLLYWLFGNVVSFGQQMLINRLNKTNEPPASEIVDSVPKNAKKVKGKPKLSTS